MALPRNVEHANVCVNACIAGSCNICSFFFFVVVFFDSLRPYSSSSSSSSCCSAKLLLQFSSIPPYTLPPPTIPTIPTQSPPHSCFGQLGLIRCDSDFLPRVCSVAASVPNAKDDHHPTKFPSKAFFFLNAFFFPCG